jgi:hypothetical protein
VTTRSKAPTLILLAMWMILLVQSSGTVFIHNASNGSAVMIILSSLAVGASSFCLLVKSLRNLQNFRFLRAFCNVSIAYFLLFFINASILFLARYIYISLF